MLYDSIEHVQRLHPFMIEAYCILLDHIHFIWRLPVGDANYSMRIGQIKRRFSKQYAKKYEMLIGKNISQEKRRELPIWQRRFWEHLVRDEEDLNQHIDYIHYNPVKHGLVARAREWEDSSFHTYAQKGYYDLDWGEGSQITETKHQFGE